MTQSGSALTEPEGPFATLHVEHTSTVERAAEELRRAIFEGEIESGTALREVALADSLGVSRPTIREALGVLVAEGLATREPHRGVHVSTPEAGSVRDVCAARWVLEGAGVSRWREADETQRDHVRTALRVYTDAVRAEGTYQELNTLHLAFHVSLVGLTGSPRLVAMAENLVVELKLALAQVERIARNAHDEADTHVALVQLLEDDDVDAAMTFLSGHLADAETEIITALRL
ncbi:GntR family transcriptional regulator [Nocardioides sp.]|uniref:GntR family transcriptional regulator n=1 Tax=Nocardioides sp. TaxID=35761 RepID=UPI00271A743F|nr:GntR family transcriptional regulator [Nocardioides sp.]MDO9456461.1 GntR family transcriptional regulator [Nocardioides sp.]